jgi:hypothetical protein
MAEETKTMTTGTIEQPIIEESPATEAELDAIKRTAFGEGFKGESTETPTPEIPDATVIPETVPAVSEPPVPEVKYAQVTEDQLSELLKLQGKMGKLDEGFGTLGHLKQMVQQIQAQNADGKPIEVTDDDMADLKAEFPEFSDLTKKVLAKVVGKLKGTGGHAAPVDTEAIVAQAEARAEARVFEKIQKDAEADLRSEHPDWRQTVWGDQDDGKTAFKDLKTPFTAWLEKQPEPIRRRIVNSNNPDFLSKQLTRFKEETAEKPRVPTPKPNERTARLAASVTPKGVAPSGSPPEENSMASGFRQEMKNMGMPVH